MSLFVAPQTVACAKWTEYGPGKRYEKRQCIAGCGAWALWRYS